MYLFVIIIGFVFLIAGAEFLVRGSSRLAALAGVSPLIIGLTIVAYGTSAPEMAVSVKAGFSGLPDLALGNVVGSNIFNILFILGISALIAPLIIDRQLIHLDVPVMIGVSILLWALAANGLLGRMEGVLFLGLGLAYTVFLILKARWRNNHYEITDIEPGESLRDTGFKGVLSPLLLIFAGLIVLYLGARWLVQGASELARQLRVSELVIGLTIVAAGTSLPELATSAVAALRGESDIAVGNIIGSNIFNILFVLGATAALSGDIRVAEDSHILDLPVMTSTAILCLPIFFTDRLISRGEGILFLGYYLAYLGYLILNAREYHLAAASGLSAWEFIALFTLFVIAVSVISDLRKKRV